MISVIVPVYNVEKYIRQCLDSIVDQTYKDLEIILVDDGSKDSSGAICDEYAQKDERIKVIHKQNEGQSIARNVGLQNATGEFVGFVDSDDTILPGMFKDMYEVASQHDLGLVCVNLHKVFDDRADKYLYPEDGAIRLLSAKDMTILNLTDKSPAYVCTHLFKRSLFDTLSFPENIYYEDRASTFRFTAACSKGAIINKSYYRYYCRQGSISRSYGWKQFRDFAFANLCRLEFINHSGLFSAEEMPMVASASADSFLRKLRHMLSKAQTEEQRNEARKWCHKLDLIPKKTRLPLKARMIRWYIERFIL